MIEDVLGELAPEMEISESQNVEEEEGLSSTSIKKATKMIMQSIRITSSMLPLSK